MSESQSRYSIVERLTDKKLEIVSAIGNLDEEIKTKKQKVDELKKNLVDWKKDIKEDVERTERIMTRKIEDAEIDCKNAEERKKTKENTYNEKIIAIETALNKIEEISKVAPQN